ncbi:MAG: hypothetical protein ACR2NH_03710, partial [Solirubrobacteraceae bacterium]
MDGRVEACVLYCDIRMQVGGAMPEQYDSLWLEQRFVSLEEPGWAVTGQDREVHVGRLAGGRALP